MTPPPPTGGFSSRFRIVKTPETQKAARLPFGRADLFPEYKKRDPGTEYPGHFFSGGEESNKTAQALTDQAVLTPEEKAEPRSYYISALQLPKCRRWIYA
jgi:hypothetical protein